jgi:hypothetical protein
MNKYRENLFVFEMKYLNIKNTIIYKISIFKLKYFTY